MNGIVNERQVDEAVQFIRRRTSIRPRVALILGSGLGDFAEHLNITSTLPSSEIPHFPHSTVVGHEGKVIFGSTTDGKKKSPSLLVFKGRIHYYETADIQPVLFPVHVAARLGASTLLVTNAAGGINRKFNTGDLMLIRDILGLSFLLLGLSPLNTKPRFEELDWPIGSRNEAIKYFDDGLTQLIQDKAKELGIALQEGTYCWLKGPTYETAAEVEMLRRIGADAVGMSTVPEIVAAKQLGMKVAGISLISNLATGITGEKLSHAEVTETATRVKNRFSGLMKNILINL